MDRCRKALDKNHQHGLISHARVIEFDAAGAGAERDRESRRALDRNVIRPGVATRWSHRAKRGRWISVGKCDGACGWQLGSKRELAACIVAALRRRRGRGTTRANCWRAA